MLQTHFSIRIKHQNIHSQKINLRNRGSNSGACGQAAALCCTRVQGRLTPSTPEISILVCGKQWYYSCVTFAKKWLADGLTHQFGGVMRSSCVLKNQSRREPGQKFHWIRGGLSLSKNVVKCAMVQCPHFLVCYRSSLFSFINTKKAISFFQ